ncbi:MAG: hypothetical protein H6822_19570 [Planctomycetaceae bacterium]|nr:hypothetical protein [Planctomycetales bacterium]MCB9924387.1 hypothetical protein [Planctomycetaceae bacterium]
MSLTHKQRGTIPPKGANVWTKEELRLLRELPPAEAAKQTGRTLTAVHLRRSKLKLPNARHVTYAGKTQSIPSWAREIGITPEALRLRLKRMTLAEALTTPKQK